MRSNHGFRSNSGSLFGNIFEDPFITDAWREFDRLFSAIGNVQSFPPYNIYALKDGSAKLEFAIAGYDQSEVTITAVDGKLVVSGKKKAAESASEEEAKDEDEDCTCAYQGIRGSSFKVSVPLQTRFDLSGAKASLKNGMLTVIVPLAEERKARTVDINID